MLAFTNFMQHVKHSKVYGNEGVDYRIMDYFFFTFATREYPMILEEFQHILSGTY